jgi:hypothetical protein
MLKIILRGSVRSLEGDFGPGAAFDFEKFGIVLNDVVDK